MERKTELQRELEDWPDEAARYRCTRCGELIGDGDYRVRPEGTISHADCTREALRLIKLHIEPGTDRGRELHRAVQIICEVALGGKS